MGDFMNGSTCMTHNGIIYFGSQNGACFFNPKELSSIRQVSPVKITQFCKYNKKQKVKMLKFQFHSKGSSPFTL